MHDEIKKFIEQEVEKRIEEKMLNQIEPQFNALRNKLTLYESEPIWHDGEIHSRSDYYTMYARG